MPVKIRPFRLVDITVVRLGLAGFLEFVPVFLENGKIYYCGDSKPSIDTPIQVRLYELLPNINYMIHSHCYIDGAPFTQESLPCGAIEEVDEVLAFIDKYYKSRELNQYKTNLIGHGSIIMGNSIDDINNVTYIKRPMPEKINITEDK